METPDKVAELKAVVIELLKVREIQHKLYYTPGYEKRVNDAWEAAERAVNE